MSLNGLVGRISYKSLSPQSLEDWTTSQWSPILGYCPEILYLKKGWLGFICRSPEDASLLLSSFWIIGGSSLMLKRWRLAFSPDSDYFQLRHLWVLLPGLPLHFWNFEACKAIGNSLGKFISLDPVTLTGSSRKMAKILVEMDITAGLPENLQIDWRGRKTLQTLDYLGLPFRCNLCRATGHLRRNCPGKSSHILSEDEELSLNPPEYTEVDPALVSCHSLPDPPSPPLPGQPEPLLSKIFHHCPSLYSSLTADEKDFINRSSLLSSLSPSPPPTAFDPLSPPPTPNHTPVNTLPSTTDFSHRPVPSPPINPQTSQIPCLLTTNLPAHTLPPAVPSILTSSPSLHLFFQIPFPFFPAWGSQ
jgi:hypothetical protein